MRNSRILIVEDDYIIARGLCDDLEQAGAIVVGPVPSVDKALRLIGTEAIDAAVLDVNLGNERSLLVAAALKAKGVPFLFATGYNAADIPAEWQGAAIAMKPLRIAEVGRLLASGGPA